MSKIKLIDDEITYKNDKIELSTINLKTLNEIVVEILDNELVVEIDDDLTSPNAIFLKALKREIDEDFKSEMEQLEIEINETRKQFEEIKITNSKIEN